MQPEISIIIPVYNAETHIRRCCETLFGQTETEIEYIFVDDCSPDKSLSIVKESLEKYPERTDSVKVVRHAENKGIASARNSGLENATGKYIGFVDADDYLEPDMIEKTLRIAKANDLDIVGWDWHMEFNNGRRRIFQPNDKTPKEALDSFMDGRLRWFLWGFMIKRDIFIANGIRFIPGANVGEDMATLIQCFAWARSYAHIAEPLYHYVKYNATSITRRSAEEQMQLISKNVNLVEKFLTERYGDRYKDGIAKLKLTVKFPLLITDNRKSYRTWQETYPEANYAIWRNEREHLRNKLLQTFAAKGIWWPISLYYKVVFKFIYGVIFK